jgi:hypothetical protein
MIKMHGNSIPKKIIDKGLGPKDITYFDGASTRAVESWLFTGQRPKDTSYRGS